MYNICNKIWPCFKHININQNISVRWNIFSIYILILFNINNRIVFFRLIYQHSSSRFLLFLLWFRR
ncbi:hypothetical protein HanRHA438_Chr09g0400491 [Helianthus annuus]|nr:hypothetical protein HanRHA438_Chr09g0400491 [Helianthus annuus]